MLFQVNAVSRQLEEDSFGDNVQIATHCTPGARPQRALFMKRMTAWLQRYAPFVRAKGYITNGTLKSIGCIAELHIWYFADDC